MFETAYLSKRLDFHPGNLAEAAAYWHRALRPVRWAPRSVRVSYGFWLDSNAVAGSADSVQLYDVRGVVWTSGRPVPVILEFSVWSETQSEVGVSPRCLSWPVGTDRYVRRVDASLEIISQTLCRSTRQVEIPREVTTTAELPVAVAQLRIPALDQSVAAPSALAFRGDRSGLPERARRAEPMLARQ
jgi:hypothetical protein